MSDPRRLIDEPGGDLGAALLRAGRTIDAEQARARRLLLMGAGGGLFGPAVATAGVKATAKGVSGWCAATWIGVGLLSAAVIAGAAIRFLPTAPAAKERAVVACAGIAGATTGIGAVAPSPPPDDAVRAAEGRPTSGLTDAVDDGQAPPRTSSRGDAADHRKLGPSAGATAVAGAAGAAGVDGASAKAGARDAASAPGGAEESLAEEVAALRKARGALAAGRPKLALTTLNTYAGRFRGGRLALEAEVLRIEALSQAGLMAEARARADGFLAAHPRSPYVLRVRALARANDTNDAGDASNADNANANDANDANDTNDADAANVETESGGDAAGATRSAPNP